MKTLDLSEAAEFLHVHPSTLLRLAGAGEIPGAKPGKCWVFIDDDLADWLRAHYRTVTTGPRAPLSEAESIASRSCVTDEDLVALLAPAKKKSRRKT